MEAVVKRWNQPWTDIKQFKSFALGFRNKLRKELSTREARITKFKIGHFYLSGFFRTKDNACFFFDISDVRFFCEPSLLYRVAKNENDYKGGINRYVIIEKGMGEKMDLK